MKKVKFISALFVLAFFASCSDDDVKPSNEEEVITTLTATFTPQGGGTPIVLKRRDLDGDAGPDAPEITVSGNFTAGTAYNGTVTFLNELENPAEDITEEVQQEGDEHQVFFTHGANLGSFEYTDEDTNGNPVGLNFIYTAPAGATSGNLTIRLVHQPDKDAEGVADGIIDNAGGSTDAEAVFNVTVNAA